MFPYEKFEARVTRLCSYGREGGGTGPGTRGQGSARDDTGSHGQNTSNGSSHVNPITGKPATAAEMNNVAPTAAERQQMSDAGMSSLHDYLGARDGSLGGQSQVSATGTTATSSPTGTDRTSQTDGLGNPTVDQSLQTSAPIVTVSGATPFIPVPIVGQIGSNGTGGIDPFNGDASLLELLDRLNNSHHQGTDADPTSTDLGGNFLTDAVANMSPTQAGASAVLVLLALGAASYFVYRKFGRGAA